VIGKNRLSKQKSLEVFDYGGKYDAAEKAAVLGENAKRFFRL
jgi:hypothetical protein